MKHVAAIVPAAGRGVRMGEGMLKQFRMVAGAPLLVHTLRALWGSGAVDSLVVALPPDACDLVLDPALPARIVPGGRTRQESVARALGAVMPQADCVLVHDAVRPFVSASEVRAVVSATQRTGAAALAIPATDTMRYGSDGRFGVTVSREGLYRMQTPQGFRRQVLDRAVAAATETATDEVALVQAIGQSVAIVPGHRKNIKITTAEDWEWVQSQWTASEDEALCA